jgi:ribokinase
MKHLFFKKSQVQILVIGDIAVDNFIKISSTDQVVADDANDGKVCFGVGSKIPYEFSTTTFATGNSANASFASAKLGLQVSILTNLGGDANGQKCLEKLKNEDIDTDFVQIHRSKSTNYHYILWVNHDRTILTKHEQYPHTLPKLPKFDWVYLTSLGENTDKYQSDILDWLLKNPTVKLAFQPGTFQISQGLSENLKKIYARTDIFLSNIEEAERIIGENLVNNNPEKQQNIRKLAERISSLGAKTVILTDGAEGSYCLDSEKLFFAPEFSKEKAVERTGAGDTYSATFITALALGENISTAMTWASANATSVCRFIGPHKGLLNRKQLDKLIDETAKFQVVELAK